MNDRSRTLIASALFGLALVAAPAAGEARESNSKEASSDFGIGVVTALANVVYMPVKVTYGVLGGITGGFAYVLSGANREVAEGVWVPSLGGDYVLTTDMMSGQEDVHFNGVRDRRPGEARVARDSDSTLGDSESTF